MIIVPGSSDYSETVVKPGDRASQYAHAICMQSYGNCPAIHTVPLELGNFRGAVGTLWRQSILRQMADGMIFDTHGAIIDWKYMEVLQNDGAGGKPQFFTLLNSPEAWPELGWEPIVMVAEDLGSKLCLPSAMMNQVDAKGVTDENFPIVKSVFDGYGAGLKKARLVNVTGEFAVMRHSITAFCDFNRPDQLVMTWSASGLGLAHRDRYIDGSTIRPGMPLIGLLEHGYRCNGGTFFTKLLLAEYGPSAESVEQNADARMLLKELTIPSKYYSASLCRIGGWLPNGEVCEPLVKMHGCAHITGGGVWKRLEQMLPKGVGATLDNMPEPPKALRLGFELSQEHPQIALSEYAAYGDLHGGVGMIVAVEPGDEDRFRAELSRDGISSEKIGYTIGWKGNPQERITIRSKFGGRRQLFGPVAE